MKPWNPWPNVIRTRRKRWGMTQTQLAEQVGVPQSYVSRWELGEYVPRPEHQRALVAALGIDPQTLYEMLTGKEPAA